MSGVVIVTGASRGIGAATALAAGREGYAVCVNYRERAAEAEAIVAQLRDQGRKAVAVQADVGREDDVIRLFETAARELGPVTALVNNAGFLEQQMPLVDMTLARVRRVFEANTFGVFLTCREAVRRMSTEFGGNGGSIVNVSSVAARSGSPHEYIDYAASKGAVDSLTIGLAKEVATQGIRVNGVRPGATRTDIHAAGGEPGRLERVAKRVPMRRGGEPEEIAEAIVWLLSDKASYMTGAIVDVTGGL